MSDKKPQPTCYDCHKPIVFDWSRKGKNDRPIPLDPETKEPHKCSEEIKANENSFHTDDQSKANKSFDEVAKEIKAERNDHGNEDPLAFGQAERKIAKKIDEKLAIQESTEPKQVTPFTTSLMKIFVSSKTEAVEADHKRYMSNIRSWGAIIKGVTYQMAWDNDALVMRHSIAITFEIPTNALDKIQ